MSQMPWSTAARGCVLSISPAEETRAPAGAGMTTLGHTFFRIHLFLSANVVLVTARRIGRCVVRTLRDYAYDSPLAPVTR